MKSYAIFDLCGTLTENENNPDFIKYCVERRLVSNFKYVLFLAAVRLRLTQLDTSSLIIGKRYNDILCLANSYAKSKKIIYINKVKEYIEINKKKGFIIVIATGAIEPIANAIANELGVENVVSTELNIENGIVISVKKLNVGDEKLLNLQRRFDPIRESFAFGVGDSKSDIPFLTACKRGFLVRRKNHKEVFLEEL